jgi:hypothetical protein
MGTLEGAAETKDKIKPEKLDRVNLNQAEAQKVAAWVEQVNAATSGFLNLSRADIVNYVVRSRSVDLSSKEIQAIRTAHYDPVKHLNWIMPRLRSALAGGDVAEVARLQSELRSMELSAGHANDTKSSSEKLNEKAIKKRRSKIGVAAEISSTKNTEQSQSDEAF